MISIKFHISIIILLLMATSCSKNEPTIPNESEVITTLIYTLTPVNGGTPAIISYRDLDGPGGNAPIFTMGTLSINTEYNAELVLKNEQANPVEDITEEINEEGVDHQFFFKTTTSNISIAYNDKDSTNNPIGILTKVNTKSAGTGELTIILRHKPNKAGLNVSSGDITNAGGETDIETTFNYEVH